MGYTQNHPDHSLAGTSPKLPNLHVCKSRLGRLNVPTTPGPGVCAALQTRAALPASSKFLQILAQPRCWIKSPPAGTWGSP